AVREGRLDVAGQALTDQLRGVVGARRRIAGFGLGDHVGHTGGGDLAEPAGEPFGGSLFHHAASFLRLASSAALAAVKRVAGMAARLSTLRYSQNLRTSAPTSLASFTRSSTWASLMAAPDPPAAPSSSSPRLVR